MSVPIDITGNWWVSLLVPVSSVPPTPPAYRYIKYKKFYVYSDGTHTHPASGRVVRVNMRWRLRDEQGMKDEMRVKMRWKLLNQDAKRGTQKKREGENTHTNTPSPERANPEKAREKKERRVDGHGPRPTEGGKTEAPEPTWHSENLQKPQHATEPTYLGREESMR